MPPAAGRRSTDVASPIPRPASRAATRAVTVMKAIVPRPVGPSARARIRTATKKPALPATFDQKSSAEPRATGSELSSRPALRFPSNRFPRETASLPSSYLALSSPTSEPARIRQPRLSSNEVVRRALEDDRGARAADEDVADDAVVVASDVDEDPRLRRDDAVEGEGVPPRAGALVPPLDVDPGQRIDDQVARDQRPVRRVLEVDARPRVVDLVVDDRRARRRADGLDAVPPGAADRVPDHRGLDPAGPDPALVGAAAGRLGTSPRSSSRRGTGRGCR